MSEQAQLIERQGVSIAVTELAGDGPVVIVLHGLAGSSRRGSGACSIVDAWVADVEQIDGGLRPRFDADVMQRTLEAVHEPRWEEWEQLQVPTRAVFAANGMFTSDDQDELIRRSPETERVNLRGGSHDAPDGRRRHARTSHWPSTLFPVATTEPSGRTASEWVDPAVTAVTPAHPSTSHCPWLLSPAARTVPSSSRARL